MQKSKKLYRSLIIFSTQLSCKSMFPRIINARHRYIHGKLFCPHTQHIPTILPIPTATIPIPTSSPPPLSASPPQPRCHRTSLPAHPWQMPNYLHLNPTRQTHIQIIVYCHDIHNRRGKIRMAWLPYSEEILMMGLFVLTQLTKVTDRHTDTAWRERPCLMRHTEKLAI